MSPAKSGEKKNFTVKVDDLLRDLESPPVKEIGEGFGLVETAEVSPSVRDTTCELKLNFDTRTDAARTEEPLKSLEHQIQLLKT